MYIKLNYIECVYMFNTTGNELKQSIRVHFQYLIDYLNFKNPTNNLTDTPITMLYAQFSYQWPIEVRTLYTLYPITIFSGTYYLKLHTMQLRKQRFTNDL